MVNELTIASSEINEILKYLSVEQVNKIPLKLRILFSKIAKEDYKPHIDPQKSILEQRISPKTKDILVIFYRNYWSNIDRRNEIDKRLIENENIYQNELSKKYNVDNILKKSNNTKIVSEVEHNTEIQNSMMVIEKDGLISRIINKLRNLFSSNK